MNFHKNKHFTRGIILAGKVERGLVHKLSVIKERARFKGAKRARTSARINTTIAPAFGIQGYQIKLGEFKKGRHFMKNRRMPLICLVTHNQNNDLFPVVIVLPVRRRGRKTITIFAKDH